MTHKIIENEESEVEEVRMGGESGKPTFTLKQCGNLSETIENLDKKDETKCIVLTGNEFGFCSGLNPKELIKHKKRTNHNELRKELQNPSRLVKTCFESSTPIIAKINGDIQGAGLGFALMCDFLVASEESSVEVSYIDYDLCLDMGLSYLLPRIIGPYRAKEVTIRDKEYNISEFENIVNSIVPRKNLENETHEFIKDVLEKEQKSVSLNKKIINNGMQTQNFEKAMKEEMWRQTSAFKWD